jgi:D-alanine-D-alanine ligase
MPAAASHLAVCFGGPSPEHDVSVLTGLQAARELVGAGRIVTGLYWSKTAEWFRVDPTLEASAFVDGVPRGAEPLRLVVGEGGFSAGGRLGRGKAVDVDVVVNACHGGPGEDGALQGAFDLAGVAYTGPHAAGAALGMDKFAFAAVVGAAGLTQLPRRLLVAGAGAEGQTGADFDGPLIVKPRFGGSSIGIKVVEDMRSAEDLVRVDPHMRRGAVVEPYRGDLFDLNVSVRQWPTLALSAIERPLKSTTSTEILAYADKYVGGEGMVSAPRELPAALDGNVADALRAMAAEVARLTDVRGIARIDFLSDGEALFVNEINTVPGSLARYLWVDPPVPFIELLDATIDEALARPAMAYSAAGADGTVLRGAGAIAAKLA